MAGERPAFSLKAKLKKGGNQPVEIGAAWAGQVGFNFRLAKDVEVFVAGVKLEPQDFWINLYDNRPSREEQDPVSGRVAPRSSYSVSGSGSPASRPPPAELGNHPPVDDDVPF